MEKVQEFLGLRPFPWKTVVNKAYNIVQPHLDTHSGMLRMEEQQFSAISNYPQMPQELRRELAHFFQPFNDQLTALLQLDQPFWEESFNWGQ
jgi:hypothetical protein